MKISENIHSICIAIVCCIGYFPGRKSAAGIHFGIDGKVIRAFVKDRRIVVKNGNIERATTEITIGIRRSVNNQAAPGLESRCGDITNHFGAVVTVVADEWWVQVYCRSTSAFIRGNNNIFRTNDCRRNAIAYINGETTGSRVARCIRCFIYNCRKANTKLITRYKFSRQGNATLSTGVHRFGDIPEDYPRTNIFRSILNNICRTV